MYRIVCRKTFDAAVRKKVLFSIKNYSLLSTRYDDDGE